MTRAGQRATTTLTVVAMVLGTLGAGCSLFDSAPDPHVTARALAAGLAKADLSGVTFKGSTPTEVTAFVTAAYAGMGDLRPEVSLSDLTANEGSDHATATLYTRWDVSPDPTDWTYRTQVGLTLVDGAWLVAWSPKIVAPELTAVESLALARSWPKRADIVDKAGTPLMTEREVGVVGIDKTRVSAAGATAAATALAKVLDINGGAYAAKVSAAGPKAFVEAITLRADDPALTGSRAAIDAVTGSMVVPRMQVLGPTRTWAAPVLGRVGEASAEQVAKSAGTLEAGDTIGQSGLEARYDEQLRGTPGVAVQAVTKGADGSSEKREIYAEVSKEAEPLVVTLDEKAQTAAEAALAGEGSRPTALVAVRVSTGEVLAAAVGPGAGGSTLALAGKAPPGSTFKIVSSLALVRKGFTAATPLPCTDRLTVDGRRFSNYTGYPSAKLGDIPLATALAYSCNTAFISQHEKVTQDDLTAAAQSLGMGEKLDLPFTGFLGSVPSTDDLVEHAASLIGQGRVEASPLTMALVVASAMKGQTVRPRLLASSPALPAPATPLDPTEAEVLRTEMRDVVKEGSGKALAPAGVEFAKTGTAEFGTKSPPDTHAWMVAGRGDIAIAAYNELGDSGTTDAAPFILDFLKAYDIR